MSWFEKHLNWGKCRECLYGGISPLVNERPLSLGFIVKADCPDRRTPSPYVQAGIGIEFYNDFSAHLWCRWGTISDIESLTTR